WPARSIAAAPAANCASISAYATAWLPLVLRQAVSIWVTIAATASPTALSSSGISSTICIVGHPPSLGLLLPLRCHGSAPGSTALLSGSPRRAASPAQDRSHTLANVENISQKAIGRGIQCSGLFSQEIRSVLQVRR